MTRSTAGAIARTAVPLALLFTCTSLSAAPAERGWRPGDGPAALAARSGGRAVTALTAPPSSFTPGDVVVTGPPVGLLLQRATGGSIARVARLGTGYVPSAWTPLSEPGYQAVSASLLDDGTGRVLWFKVIGSQTHVRLWHTDAAFARTSMAEFDIGAEWVPFAHSQKYAAGLGFIGFRRLAAGAASNETFFWHLGWNNGLPDQIVGGTWIPQQEGGAAIPSGFAQVGRGGRLLFSNPGTGCGEVPSACRLGYTFWIVDDHMQMAGAHGYEAYDTKMWDPVGRLPSDWRAVAQADDEILFVRNGTGEARLRFFDRLNSIALEKVFTPDAGYVFAGYTRTAAQHHVPSAAEQAMLDGLRTRGCGATNLLTSVFGAPGAEPFDEQAALLARSECASFVMELPPWGVMPNFPLARSGKEAIEARTTRRLQFSFYLAEVVDENNHNGCYPDGSCYDFGTMCYVNPASGQRVYPYGGSLCAPDVRKPAYWSYVEHTFGLALDNGFTNFIFGPVWFQDALSWSYLDTVADTPGDAGIVTRVNRLRALAAQRGVPVIFGGAYDGLSLESATVFDYVWHITNTAYQAPGGGGFPVLYEDRPCHPVSVGPYCPALAYHYKYHSVVPTVSVIDVNGWADEIHSFAGLGYGSGATAAERERRRACFLENMFDAHRRTERLTRTAYLPAMVNLLSGGSRGLDAWPPPAPDSPVINGFGPPQEFLYSSSNTYTHPDACHDEDVINRLLRGEPAGVDCTVTVADPVRDAQLLRTEIPPRMIAGRVYGPGAHYRNKGSVFWGAPFPVKAGVGCPAGAATWACPVQPVAAPVGPAESRTLLATVTAPGAPGNYALQLGLFDTAPGQWFGPATTPFTVSVVAASPVYEAQFLSQKVPLRMHAGGSYTVPVTFRNLGSAAWNDIGNHCGAFRLAPTAGPAWTAAGRVELPAAVPAGGSVTLQVPVTAPAAPGTYDFQWRLLKECELWFGDWTPSTPIVVY